jgi:hypothetical protein
MYAIIPDIVTRHVFQAEIGCHKVLHLESDPKKPSRF